MLVEFHERHAIQVQEKVVFLYVPVVWPYIMTNQLLFQNMMNLCYDRNIYECVRVFEMASSYDDIPSKLDSPTWKSPNLLKWPNQQKEE